MCCHAESLQCLKPGLDLHWKATVAKKKKKKSIHYFYSYSIPPLIEHKHLISLWTELVQKLTGDTYSGGGEKKHKHVEISVWNKSTAEWWVRLWLIPIHWRGDIRIIENPRTFLLLSALMFISHCLHLPGFVNINTIFWNPNVRCSSSFIFYLITTLYII